MKVMKSRFRRYYNAVLAALLSMLGYACSSSDEPVEYGTPHADYIFNGQVTDESGNPIPGIKSSVKEIQVDRAGKVSVYPIDSMLTDASGNYRLKITGWPGGLSESTKIILEDTDGAANGGEFLGDTIDVAFGRAVKTKDGDGKWYYGAYEITQNATLKKK